MIRSGVIGVKVPGTYIFSMRAIFLLLVFILAVLLNSPAHAEWLFNGQSGEAPYAKTNGKFGAQLIFVDDNEKLFEAWDQPDLGVKISDVKKISRNKPISSFIIFSNAASNKKGKTNVTAKFFVINPAGKIVSETKELEVWKNRPNLKERELGLSVDFMQLSLKDKDPLGNYTVKVLVLDSVANLSVELERQFELVDK